MRLNDLFETIDFVTEDAEADIKNLRKAEMLAGKFFRWLQANNEEKPIKDIMHKTSLDKGRPQLGYERYAYTVSALEIGLPSEYSDLWFGLESNDTAGKQNGHLHRIYYPDSKMSHYTASLVFNLSSAQLGHTTELIWMTSEINRSTMIHELIHYFDAKRQQTTVRGNPYGIYRSNYRYSKGTEEHNLEYYNNAHEFNAFFQQGMHMVLKNIIEVQTHNKDAKRNLSTFNGFKAAFLMDFREDFRENMTPETKIRFEKRLYKLWEYLKEKFPQIVTTGQLLPIREGASDLSSPSWFNPLTTHNIECGDHGEEVSEHPERFGIDPLEVIDLDDESLEQLAINRGWVRIGDFYGRNEYTVYINGGTPDYIWKALRYIAKRGTIADRVDLELYLHTGETKYVKLEQKAIERFLKLGPKQAWRVFDENTTINESLESWFGNSKIKTSDGKPLKVYHGTGESFDTFNNSNLRGSGSREGPLGFWFTDDPHVASEFADWSSRGGYTPANVIPAYLKIEHPWIVSSYKEIRELVNKHSRTRRGEPANLNFPMVDDKVDYNAAKKDLLSQGYDGIILPNTMTDSPYDDKTITQYVVFHPTQIKSAIGNNGKFDPSKENITESFVGSQGGFWITETGDILECNHDKDMHHAEIALQNFDLDDEEDEESTDAGWALRTMALDAALDNGWIQVSTYENHLTIGWKGWPSTETKQALLSWVSKYGKMFSKGMYIENGFGNQSFDDPSKFYYKVKSELNR